MIRTVEVACAALIVAVIAWLVFAVVNVSRCSKACGDAHNMACYSDGPLTPPDIVVCADKNGVRVVEVP